MNRKIALKFYVPRDFEEVNYALSPEQMRFTNTPEGALQRIKERNDERKKAVCIFMNDQIAGFFVLDTSDDKKELTENEAAILLRSLSLNPFFQGQGIAKEAMLILPDFVRIHYAHCTEIVLAVNFENPLAYGIYLKTNFIDDGKTNQGRSGLQHILTLQI